MSEITSQIDLYPPEAERVKKVGRVLSEKVGTYRNVESFRREIIGRFEDIGLVVQVKAGVPADPCLICEGVGTVSGTPFLCIQCQGSGSVASGQPEFVAFDIDIVDRVTGPELMDWDRYGEEVRAVEGSLGAPPTDHIDHPGHKKGSGCC